MLPLNGHKERGVTLTEMVVVVVIAGILAAVAIPSFWGMYNRTKINEGLAQVEGALKEVQKEAIRRGKTCKVRIDETTNKVTDVPGSEPSEQCLFRERDLEKIGSGVRMEFNGTETFWDINYSFRGNTTNEGADPADLVVIYWEGQGNSATTHKRCLVMTPGTGIVRTGDYEGTVASLNQSNCR